MVALAEHASAKPGYGGRRWHAARAALVLASALPFASGSVGAVAEPSPEVGEGRVAFNISCALGATATVIGRADIGGHAGLAITCLGPDGAIGSQIGTCPKVEDAQWFRVEVASVAFVLDGLGQPLGPEPLRTGLYNTLAWIFASQSNQTNVTIAPC